MDNKIRGQNIHFTGEKEERLPETRQYLYDVIDIQGKQDPCEPISIYFKKKCLKSKLISGEIEDLKGYEECERNQALIKNMYTFNESLDKDHNRGLKKEDFFDLETGNNYTIEKFQKLFLSNPKKKFDMQVFKDPCEGTLVALDIPYRVTIMIRLDYTNKVPKAWWFCKYHEKDRSQRYLKPEAKSKWKYMQSLNEVAIHAMNSYTNYYSIPIIYFCEWLRGIKHIFEEECPSNRVWLYWNEKYGMIPSDHLSLSIGGDKKDSDAKLIHKTCKVFQ